MISNAGRLKINSNSRARIHYRPRRHPGTAMLALRPPRTTGPISVGWTVPYRDSVFHLGIHNLPAPTANEWTQTFAEFTAVPSVPRLKDILSQLDVLPDVLIVLNHPVWDLYNVGPERHFFCINDFMSNCSHFIHAMELNGLRGWPENRRVTALAQEWEQLLISGGDRHGVQPNANINLTNAASFDEFVHEVRNEGISHILFMPRYAEPRKHRIFSQLWPGDGRAPAFVRYVLGSNTAGPFSRRLRLAWSDPHGLRMTLNCQDA